MTFDAPPVRDLCGCLQQPRILAGMPASIFPEGIADKMTAYVREITGTPREKYEMTVISLFGGLIRRVNLVARPGEALWFPQNPDPGYPTQA